MPDIRHFSWSKAVAEMRRDRVTDPEILKASREERRARDLATLRAGRLAASQNEARS